MKSSFTTSVILLATFIGVSLGNAGEVQKQEFSITLPEEWVELSREALLAGENEKAKAAPRFEGMHFDNCFYLPLSKNWDECPSVSIKVAHTGRIPKSQWDKLAVSYTNTINNSLKGLSDTLSDVGIGKTVYDRQSGIIWVRLQATTNTTPPVSTSSLGATIPTEDGLIIVSCKSLTKDYPTYEPVFQSIAKSLTPIASLVYKPRPSEGTLGERLLYSIGQATTVGIAFGIFGLIGVLVHLLRKKQQKTTPPSDTPSA